MKPSEVAIIVAVVAILGYFFTKDYVQTTPQKPAPQTNNLVRTQQIGPSPVNAATPVYGPPVGSLVNGQIYTCCGEVL